MTFKKLFESKKNITIGYIGGSITAQDGYRCTFTNHLKEAFPNNEIKEINAAMGGTNSFLGVCRIDRDLVSEKPDIAVIEFSVNDGCDKEEEYFRFFGRTYEGMIRKLLKSNPDMLIAVIGLTTEKINNDFYSKGKVPYTVQNHKKVCDYYGIPFVNAGKAMYDQMIADGADMLKYTNDRVHTNECGGKFYGNVFWNELESFDFDINFKNVPLYDDNFEYATLYMADKVEEGWHNGSWLRGDIHENYIYSYTPGSEITVDFYGSVFGIYCTTEKTSGNIKYSVDGGEWKERATWDKYAIDFDRLHFYTLEDNLKKENHTVKIKVSENKEEKSEGYYLRIIAFLVEKP